MCALFLNCRVSKAMARSNWDRLELSPRQVVYAATDAWLSLRVYMEMKRWYHVVDSLVYDREMKNLQFKFFQGNQK